MGLVSTIHVVQFRGAYANAEMTWVPSRLTGPLLSEETVESFVERTFEVTSLFEDPIRVSFLPQLFGTMLVASLQRIPESRLSIPEFSDEESLMFEALMYGETALTESSPAERTSPAAIAASTLINRVITGGGIGTSISSATSIVAAHDPQIGMMVFLVGAGGTLVVAISGAGLTLVSHWLAKRMNL